MGQRTALITGASDFVGPPAVDALAEAGFRVLVQDASFASEDSWRRYRDAHPAAERIDVPEPADAVAVAWEQAGRIDALVSNDHHPAKSCPTEDADADELDRSLAVLVVRPFRLMQAAIPLLKAQGGGNVVMITSCRTQLPMAGGAIPDMCRAAENALVRSLAIELAPANIAVNAIAPNFLYSEAYYPRAVFIDDPAGRAFVEASVPAGRLGEPAEVGEVVRFLATTKARFLTGAVIDFSGGWPASPVRPKSG
jgi:NAD(P)-dependent dehydrogenase (short-subunit alcohol dehydrogenase family)